MRTSRNSQRGYALIIMIVLLTMGLLYGVVSQLSLVEARVGRAQGTQTVLLQAKEALIGYAATYRDTHPGEVFGYLPCPDADGDGDADTVNSSANCASSNQVVVGMLPYKTLGLNDLRDAANECLWYAVSPAHKASLTKVEPMNWDTRGQIRIRDSDGTTVLADPVTGAEGGAVAVIFAAGPPLSNNTAGRGNSSSNVCSNSGKANWRAFLESVGFDSTGVNGFDSSGNSTANPLTVTKGTIDGVSNNDQIAWITPKDIFERVRKRTDQGGLNILMTEIRAALAGKITSDLAAGTVPVIALPATPTPITGAYTGQVGALPATLAVANSNDTKLLSNWNEQYRSVVCSNLCSYCLNVGGQSCNGALVFGAEHTTGGPRPSHPTVLTDLLETDGPASGDGKGGLNIATGVTNTFTGLTTYTKGSNDVGICVAPITSKPVTFSCDISSFTQQSTHAGARAEASINTAAGTATLGNTAATSGLASDAGNGCVWYPTALPFHTVLRAYFSFNIVNKGEGFVFALADAIQNPSPVCGGSTTGSLLGYNGNTYPKFGLEIDTRRNSFSTDQLTSGEHYAFVYWGTKASTTDDNTHGAGTPGSPAEPQNPVASAAPSGLSVLTGTDPNLPASTSWLINTPYYVRVDIVKSYALSPGTYTFKAYIATTFPTCPLADFQNISSNLSDLCSTLSPGIEQDGIAIDNISGEAMASVFAGFTSGQRATGTSNESVVISNFAIRSQ